MKKIVGLLFITVLLACVTGCALGQVTTLEPDVLFRDDFSRKNSGWDNFQDESGMTAYDQDGYRIQVLQAEFDYWSNPNLNLQDVVIEVEAKKLAGPDENDFGILCRYQDEGNFYFLIAGNDGYFGIGKVSAGIQALIGMESMEPHAAINTGDGAINQLRAECVGETLTLMVNGTEIRTVTDPDFKEGDVGLIAGTFEEPGTDVLFDNFVVRKP